MIPTKFLDIIQFHGLYGTDFHQSFSKIITGACIFGSLSDRNLALEEMLPRNISECSSYQDYLLRKTAEYNEHWLESDPELNFGEVLTQLYSSQGELLDGLVDELRSLGLKEGSRLGFEEIDYGSALQLSARILSTMIPESESRYFDLAGKGELALRGYLEKCIG